MQQKGQNHSSLLQKCSGPAGVSRSWKQSSLPGMEPFPHVVDFLGANFGQTASSSGHRPKVPVFGKAGSCPPENHVFQVHGPAQHTSTYFAGITLALVADGPQEALAHGDIFLGLYARRGKTVHNAHDPPTLLGFGNHDLNRIGRAAEQADNLWYIEKGILDIDGEHVAHKKNEAVAARKIEGVFSGQLHQFIISTGPAHQPLVRGFAKGKAEFGSGHRTGNGLVHVFHGFDEMGHAQNEIEGIGIFYLYQL
jgi:hypothetical protein